MGAVFLKLVNMSITASWLIAAVILLRIVLKKAPKWVSCMLWVLVAIRLLCPVAIESSLSLVPSADTYPVNAIYNSDTNVSNNPYNRQIHTGFEAIDGQPGNNTILQDVSTGATLRSNINIIAYVWIIGMAAMFIFSAISYRKLNKSVHASVPFRDNVRICDDIQSPFILGIIKPIVYLPSFLTDETLENVLTHEAAHLKRHDHWWKPLGYLLLAIYWFNPLCWLAYILLCRDIEMACDEKVIRDMDNSAKAAYSQALLYCSFPRRRIAACPLAFGEVGVKERVKSVLNYKKPAFWIIVVAAVACIVIGVCFMTNPKVNEPDLSFLNYKNAIPLLVESDDLFTIYNPPAKSNEATYTSFANVDGVELARYLDLVTWQKRRVAPSWLASPGSVEFCIDEEYRITVYQKSKLAKVTYNGEERYYRIHKGDYEKAVELLYSEAGTGAVDNEAVSIVAPNEMPISSVGGVDEPISATTNIRTEVCELYLKVLEDLWNVDSGLNGGITQIGIDLSGLTHLTEEEKESVMNVFASKHNLPYIAGTWEELCEQGYIDKDNLYWEDGLFFSIETNEDAVWNLPAIKEGDSVQELTAFNAHKWRSGLGAYFFGQCTAQKNADGTWSYTVGAEMIS